MQTGRVCATPQRGGWSWPATGSFLALQHAVQQPLLACVGVDSGWREALKPPAAALDLGHARQAQQRKRGGQPAQREVL